MIRPNAIVLWGAVALAALGGARDLRAQGYPFSQRGSVSQMIAFTEVTVTYGRPVARGRALFGALVPWDAVWHPGADSATVISFSRDVLLEGREVKAGEYSAWLIPRERGPWTLILSHAAHVFHTPYPGSARDALRVDLQPETLSHMESMAVYFPEVLRDEGSLRIHWGTLAITAGIKAPFRPD
jgi:hypothetical protein